MDKPASFFGIEILSALFGKVLISANKHWQQYRRRGVSRRHDTQLYPLDQSGANMALTGLYRSLQLMKAPADNVPCALGEAVGERVRMVQDYL
jgi:hypothetical protein